MEGSPASVQQVTLHCSYKGDDKQITVNQQGLDIAGVQRALCGLFGVRCTNVCISNKAGYALDSISSILSNSSALVMKRVSGVRQPDKPGAAPGRLIPASQSCSRVLSSCGVGAGAGASSGKHDPIPICEALQPFAKRLSPELLLTGTTVLGRACPGLREDAMALLKSRGLINGDKDSGWVCTFTCWLFDVITFFCRRSASGKFGVFICTLKMPSNG